MPALSQTLTFTPDHYPSVTATTAVVYPNSATNTVVFVGHKLQGNGYYGVSGGIHTAMYVADMNFVGTITMQATLATEPADLDWFDVAGTTVNYTEMDSRSTSTVDCVNFDGNFVWVRGNVAIDQGSVQYILYNH